LLYKKLHHAYYYSKNGITLWPEDRIKEHYKSERAIKQASSIRAGNHLSLLYTRVEKNTRAYRKASGKAPVIHPGDEAPFLSRRRGGEIELAFVKQKEYTAVV
jgi:hypothetical protein